jgi:V8-like Glu-specific endopeptidase
MATKKYPTTAQPKSVRTVQEEKEGGDLLVMGGEAQAPTETRLVVEEVSGQVSPDTLQPLEAGMESDSAHTEVSADRSESAEEYAEATAEQLAAGPSVDESAFSDLRNIEGFEEFVGEETGEEAKPAPQLLPDAGAATEGGQEFLPILGTLAATVLPTLVSKIGPRIAKGVIQKLTPKAKAILRARKKGGGPLAVIARLLEAAELQPTEASESGMEAADEAVVNEAAQLLEVIIGTDDRARITPTQRVPWRRICALRIFMPSGAVFRGTGFFIGARVLATAGHCVFMHNQGGWARRIEVIPGCNGTNQPFGQATATTFRSVNGWTQLKKPECDYGCIVLPAGAFRGQTLGSFGFGALPTSDLLAEPAVVAGYPGDKPFAELWGMKLRIKAATALQLVYDIDTVGGQSGCPVHIKKGGKRYVVGIHNYGAATGNSATRITPTVFQNLQQWSKIGTEAAAQPQPRAAAVGLAA